MIKKTMKVTLGNELDVRPIAELVQVASKYDSRIYIELGTKRVNAKSIMGMMSLDLGKDGEIVVSADGTDEEAALKEIEEFVSERR